MAKVKTATEGERPRANLRIPRTTRATPGAFGADFSGFADSGLKLLDSLSSKFQREADDAFITEGMSNWVTKSSTDFEEAKGTANESAQDFSLDLNTKLKGDLNPFVEELQGRHSPSQEAINDLTNRINGRIGTTGVKATGWEFGVRRAFEAQGLENSVKGLELDAFNNPDNFESNRADLNDILDRASRSKSLSPEQLIAFDNAEERVALATINGLTRANPKVALEKIENGDFDTWLTTRTKSVALDNASSKIEDEETRLKVERREKEKDQEDKEVASVLLATREESFNADKLIEGVETSEVLTETQKARQILFIDAERDQRALTIEKEEEKHQQANRVVLRSDLDDAADRGALTMDTISSNLKKPVEENPYAGTGGAEAWERHRKAVRKTRPQWFRLEENAKTINDNKGLVEKSFAGDLTVEEMDSIKQSALIAGAPQEQQELLDELTGVVLNQQGGISGQRDNEIYVSLNNRIRDAKIKFGTGGVSSGKVSDVEATVTDMIKLQRDVLKAERLGKISKDESQSFLTKVMLGLEYQVGQETGLSILGFGGGPTDVYDGGYEQITQLLKKNNQEDDDATKAALMRTFVFAAEKSGVDEMEDGPEKEKKLDEISRAISAQYAKTISPSLSGLSPESLPNSVFVGGKSFSIFEGVSSATPDKRLQSNIKTVRQGDTIFEFIEGTNPPVVISSRKVTETK